MSHKKSIQENSADFGTDSRFGMVLHEATPAQVAEWKSKGIQVSDGNDERVAAKVAEIKNEGMTSFSVPGAAMPKAMAWLQQQAQPGKRA